MNLIKKRNYQLDLIRVIACLMVVIMHSPLPTDKSNTIFLNILNYSTCSADYLFFLYTGKEVPLDNQKDFKSYILCFD